MRSDTLAESIAALRVHKLRAVLTILGLTLGVATLITVMTLVQGANVYVEQKIVGLGTDVFQIARVPFTVTNFDQVIKALRNKRIELEDMQAVSRRCPACQAVGAGASTTVRVKYRDLELQDVTLNGNTANMVEIDSRTVELGRYFTPAEEERTNQVCLIGATLVEQFFPGLDPTNRVVRIANQEFRVIGTLEKLGSVLGMDQDNFVIIPLATFLRLRGSRQSLVISAKALPGERNFEAAQDQARLSMRARRHISGGKDEDFFIGTRDSYIELWKSISTGFFSVFVMVSSISAVVGGIVIMNVMLVSVTERTKEIGIRRAVGATQADIRRQFLTESVLQCLLGGVAGISLGFLCALSIRSFTSFPASVQGWVAILGLGLSSAIGLFFGIYPAVRASRLDPVEALRAD